VENTRQLFASSSKADLEVADDALEEAVAVVVVVVVAADVAVGHQTNKGN